MLKFKTDDTLERSRLYGKYEREAEDLRGLRGDDPRDGADERGSVFFQDPKRLFNGRSQRYGDAARRSYAALRRFVDQHFQRGSACRRLRVPRQKHRRKDCVLLAFILGSDTAS